MLDTISSAAKLQMKFRRPNEFTVTIDKGGGTTFGVGLDFLTDGTSMMITEVRAGPVMDWNKANKGKEVQPQDRIVAVNGKRGLSNVLLDGLQIAQIPELLV